MTAAVSVEDDLRSAVAAATPRLLALSEAEAERAPAPGKWSPKEVVGHLIDSASNNHGRFVRAQFQEDLVFAGYEQESWVASQRYRTAPWKELVELWRLYNLHLARVIEALPASVRERPRERHNLDAIAWRTVPRETPTTLEYFLRDYVAHLKHHLGQIRGAGTEGS
ncbi:MAG TPA: DinB family protein [Thermoanaerobaculia bacterium]|nr:DinB family protein [Thermoanaerobaculia bacterium]